MWTAYELVYRVKSPIHIGHRKVGNLMVTRRYVPARVFLGALTSKIAFVCADKLKRPLTTDEVKEIGKQINENITFSYFFLCTRRCGDRNIPDEKLWFPWNDNGDSSRMDKLEFRFIGSYVSTSLRGSSSERAGEEGMLHEVEFISPYDKVDGNPVYIKGYMFVKWDDDGKIKVNLGSRNKCFCIEENILEGIIREFQLGGERSYGWGKVVLERSREYNCEQMKMFGKYSVLLNSKRPAINLDGYNSIPGHLISGSSASVKALGEIEPLFRRVSINLDDRFEVAYCPGSVVYVLNKHIRVKIDILGYLRCE